MRTLLNYLKEIFPQEYLDLSVQIQSLLYDTKHTFTSSKRVHNTILLSMYPDSLTTYGEKPLKTLDKFLKNELKNLLKSIHILPAHPFSHNDNYSIIDYNLINSDFGSWDDFREITKSYNIMIDGVFNHMSSNATAFYRFLNKEYEYNDYFLTKDDSFKYDKFYRPIETDLFVTYKKQEILSTFEDYKVDLNIYNPKVFIQLIKLIIFYANLDVKYIRLDKIAHIFKESNTTSFNNDKDHLLVKIINYCLKEIKSDITLIADVGQDISEGMTYLLKEEAKYVYNHAFAPLVLLSFIKGDITNLVNYLSKLKTQTETYLINYLGSPYPIELDSLSNIVDFTDKDLLVNDSIRKKAKIAYRKTKKDVRPYQITCNFMNLLYEEEESTRKNVNKIIAAYAILLSVKGIPNLYINELLGFLDDKKIHDYQSSVNKIHEDKESFNYLVYTKLIDLIKLRNKENTFFNDANQKISKLHPKVFFIERYDKKTKYTILVNISPNTVLIKKSVKGSDLLSKKIYLPKDPLKPYQILWIKN